MGKTKKKLIDSISSADTHMRIPRLLWDKFTEEAKILGRKHNTHFKMILEERYNPKESDHD